MRLPLLVFFASAMTLIPPGPIAHATDDASQPGLPTEEVHEALERALKGFIAVSYPRGPEDGCQVSRSGDFKLLTNGLKRVWFQVEIEAKCISDGPQPLIMRDVVRFLCQTGRSQNSVDCTVSGT